MNSVWESFQAATLSLVRSGSIKDRLSEAWRQHLCHVQPESLPKELRDDFAALTDDLTHEPPAHRGEDAVRATIRKMSNHDADLVAERVVRLFAAMPRAAAAPRQTGPAQVVPLFIGDEAAAPPDRVIASAG